MSDILACACSADVYNEPGLNENGEEEGAVIEVLAPERCAEILGLHSPDASYLERRRAYIKAALVFSRLVGPATPWNDRSELMRRGAGSFCDVEAAFEGLRATREPVPGFAPDDFLPQLRCSSDGGRTFDEAKPPVSAMLHADVRAAPGADESLANPEFEIAVKFSTTRFVLARTLTEFHALHKSLAKRVPTCARSLPGLPTAADIDRASKAAAPHGSSSAQAFLGGLFGGDAGGREKKATATQLALAEAKVKLRAYLSQAIDWFRARRVYDPEVLAFIDLDAELLLRLHREDMRVVRNIVVSWGGHVAHAVPSKWVRQFVASITPRRGRGPAPDPLGPGAIRLRECLDNHADTEGAWDLVTKPAWIVLSSVYGADVELDIETLRKLMTEPAAKASLDAAPQMLLGLPVGTANGTLNGAANTNNAAP